MKQFVIKVLSVLVFVVLFSATSYCADPVSAATVPPDTRVTSDTKKVDTKDSSTDKAVSADTKKTDVVAAPKDATANNDNSKNIQNGSKPLEKKQADTPKKEISLDMYKDPAFQDFLDFKQDKIGTVKDIKVIQGENDSFKLVFVVDRKFIANVKVINFPFRLILDLPMPYQWGVNAKDLKNKIPVNVIQGFRYGRSSKNVFRIVADLVHPVYVVKSYITSKGKDFNFVIDLAQGMPTQSVKVADSVTYVNDVEQLSKISEISLRKNEDDVLKRKLNVASKVFDEYLSKVTYPKPVSSYKDRPITVVLDPGHGGKDPGARAENNLLVEKEIVLKVATLLQSSLQNNPEINVILTRRGDYYLPLKDRILWAQSLKADLFVSLHADKAEGNSSASGMSIYTLSDVASDAQAQLLANDASKYDLTLNDDTSKDILDENVSRILLRLSQRVKVNDSTILARNIVSSSVGNIKIMDNPIKSAGFAVLKVPTVPSILVEMGFLSNPDDVSLFRTDDYVNKFVESLSVGIQSYLWDRGSLSIIPKIMIEKEEKEKKELNMKKQQESQRLIKQRALELAKKEAEELSKKTAEESLKAKKDKASPVSEGQKVQNDADALDNYNDDLTDYTDDDDNDV